MAKVSNTTDNRNGRVHSRHIDPIVQKIPYTNLENVQARGFSAAARNFQERGKTSNLPKDEAKEGTGQRLLNGCTHDIWKFWSTPQPQYCGIQATPQPTATLDP